MIVERYLHLYQDGGSDLDLNDTDAKTYVVDDTWTPRSWDGKSEYIDDDIPVTITGATVQAVLAARTAISRFLTLAEFRQSRDRSMGRFWLSHYPDTSETNYADRIRKAEVLDGSVDPVERIRKAIFHDTVTQVESGFECRVMVKVRHSITRSAAAITLTMASSDYLVTSSVQSPTLVEVELVGGEDWVDSNNIKVADGNFATSDVETSFSQNLKAETFGFVGIVPVTATILGVKVEIKAKEDTGGNVDEKVVQLLVAGTRAGTNDASHTLTSTNAYCVHGGASSMWGLALTPAIVNHVNFGVAIGYESSEGGGAIMVYVDHVRMTVYYSVPTSTAVAIYNHDDATMGHNNFVKISPVAQQTGELPAAADVYVENVSPGGQSISELWAGVAYPQGAHTFSFNAEDASTGDDTTLVDDVTAPGVAGAGGIGQRAECTFATWQAIDTAHTRLTWTIMADVRRYQGRYKALMRARADIGTDVVTAQLAITHAVNAGNAYSEVVTVEHAASGWIWHDLGVFDIPMGNIAGHAHPPPGLKIGLMAANTGTTDHLHIADILIMPVHVSSLHVPYEAVSSEIAVTTGRYHIDQQWRPEDGVMAEAFAAGAWEVLNRVHCTGQLPLFVPEQSYGAYLVFACSYYASGQSYAPIDLQMEVAVDYTPRWYSL